MQKLVQSACPGCKHLLRIPAEWLHQPIRCKHCGMVMHAKQPTTTPARPAAVPPKPVNQTPPPGTRKAAPVAAPLARLVAPTGKAAPAAPLAILVTQAPISSPFGNLDPETDEAPQTARRSRKPRSWWKGPVLTLSVLVVASIVAVANWDRIKALLPPMDEQTVAQNDNKGKNPVVAPPPKKIENKRPTPNPDKPKKNDPPRKNEPPKNEPPKDKPKNPPKNDPPKRDPPRVVPPRVANNSPFPRRALIISVHDYLYANPIHDGPHLPGAQYLGTFIEQLNKGFRIPLNQIAHLSDMADRKYGTRAPTRTVIEKTLTNFLDSSRPQDRIMVFFIGHAIELGDDVYLAPIEGELDKADTLIPLKWMYDKLAACKARQKVLVFDGNRYNQTFGQERPGSGEMGPKLDAMLKAPPAGVQVWSSCIEKQKSYETDDSPMGVFLDEFYDTVKDVTNKGLLGKIQQPEDPLPLEKYVGWVNEHMKKDLDKRKLEQVSRLTGKEADAGVAYDKSEPQAPDALTSLAGAPEAVAVNKMLIESLLDQIGTPPVKVTHEMALRFDALPPFSLEALQKYQGDRSNPDSPLRKAIKNARATLYAIYPGVEPKELSKEVSAKRGTIKVQLTVLKEGYRAPAGGNAENQFKVRVENDERAVALIMRSIDDALDDLLSKEVVEAREKESKRWQANYDFILARVQLEYAYLFEYQSMLGSMRKEFPPRDAALQGGWKLASQMTLTGDGKGKKFARDGQKLLDKIAKDNAGSPWEVLAKREKLTNLGLEWQAAK